jgi:hypothetical protein
MKAGTISPRMEKHNAPMRLMNGLIVGTATASTTTTRNKQVKFLGVLYRNLKSHIIGCSATSRCVILLLFGDLFSLSHTLVVFIKLDNNY